MPIPDEQHVPPAHDAEQQPPRHPHNHVTPRDVREWVQSIASQKAGNVSDDEAAWARSMTSQQAKTGR